MTVKRPILRYHGGKWMLAPWIISHFPPHKVYVEPYGGAGSVLMRKSRSEREVYNDKWGDVVNVFKVLRDPELSRQLKIQMELTPFARDEYSAATGIAAEPDPVEKARKFLVLAFMGFGSASCNENYNTGFRAKTNRLKGGTAETDWANYPKHIAGFTERLKGVCIENKDAIEVIQQQDTIDTLHYIDPPYDPEVRTTNGKPYAHDMFPIDHWNLAEAAREAEGYVIVSGYDSELYSCLYHGWHKVKKNALADGAAKRIEVLWCNKRVEEYLKTYTLFS